MDGTYNQANVTGISNYCSTHEIIPNRYSPRTLSSSQFSLVQQSDGNLVYDSPEETDQYLHKKQGSAYSNFQGTCGLCSCANILRLAGVNATEAQMIEYAATTDNPWYSGEKLCAVGKPDPGHNGGTSPYDRQQILAHFGIQSDIVPLSDAQSGDLYNDALVTISDNVCAGRGVIISVFARVLWHNNPYDRHGRHAVSVTSVKKAANGNLLGFYICDSARNGTTYYPAALLQKALTGGAMNVTRSIIR